MRLRTRRLPPIGTLSVLVSLLAPSRGAAQDTVSRIPLVPGLTLLSSLHFAEGDRENVVEVGSVDSAGVRYTWRLFEVRANGDTIVEQFGRHVRANDFAGRLASTPSSSRATPRSVPATLPSRSRPPCTRSSATRARRRKVTTIESAQGVFGAVTSALGAGAAQERTRFKGTLTRVSPQPAPFPLLVDGRRVTVQDCT